VHNFQLSVLIVLRVDPANVGVGCANVLMANGFSNGGLIGCSSQQKSLCRLVAGQAVDTLRHCTFMHVAFPTGRISFKCHRLPLAVDSRSS
jgi:hypothetical protein